MSYEIFNHRARKRSFGTGMIVKMGTSLRVFGGDGALFTYVTCDHAGSLVTTITMTVSVAGRLSKVREDSETISTRQPDLRSLRAEIR